MISGLILLFLQTLSMTGGHIIIYGTVKDSKHPDLEWDGESEHLERQIADVKHELVSVKQHLGILKNRVEQLDNSVEGKNTLLKYLNV
jgi:hypothetical protein